MNIIDSITNNLQKVIVRERRGYSVYSHDRKKRLGGPYSNRGRASKRLRQVEYFKHMDKVQKMARKRAIYAGPWREGERPPKGLRRGDIFRDDKGKMWGIVGQGSQKRVVRAWKVPHYTPTSNIPRKIPHGESFIGPSGKVHTIAGGKLVESGRPYTRAPGPKHKKKVKLTRTDKELIHAATVQATPRNVSRKWPKHMKEHKQFLREKATSYGKWKRSFPVRMRRPAAIARNIGLGVLAAAGAYHLGRKALKTRQKRSERSEITAEAAVGKRLHKSIGFINDVGYYQTFDRQGNVLFLRPSDGRALEKGTKSIEQASLDTLLNIVNNGMINSYLMEKGHGRRNML